MNNSVHYRRWKDQLKEDSLQTLEVERKKKKKKHKENNGESSHLEDHTLAKNSGKQSNKSTEIAGLNRKRPHSNDSVSNCDDTGFTKSSSFGKKSRSQDNNIMTPTQGKRTEDDGVITDTTKAKKKKHRKDKHKDKNIDDASCEEKSRKRKHKTMEETPIETSKKRKSDTWEQIPNEQSITGTDSKKHKSKKSKIHVSEQIQSDQSTTSSKKHKSKKKKSDRSEQTISSTKQKHIESEQSTIGCSKERSKKSKNHSSQQSTTEQKSKKKKNHMCEPIPSEPSTATKQTSKKTKDDTTRPNPSKSPSSHKSTRVLTADQEDLVHTTWRLNSADEERLQAMGITLRKGKWSKEEEMMLQHNMEEYQELYGIEDPAPLIFAYKDEDTEQGKRLRELAANTGFYRHLAKGICRSVFLVYRRVLRFYDKQNYKGKFTEEETQELRRLQRIHGNNWSKIGEIMGRSLIAVQHKFNILEGTRGQWTDEEIAALQTGVRAITQTKPGEAVYTQIYWKSVASYVKTRNADQCRVKWLKDVCWRELHADEKRWTDMDGHALIEAVYNSSATDESDLNWNELADGLKGRARSPQWLRGQWWKLKTKYCSTAILNTMDFEVLVDHLYNTIKPHTHRIHTDKAIE